MILLLAMISLTGCSTKTEQETISEAVGIDCSEGEVVVSEDTHGGFHGDGETYIVLNFQDGALEMEIAQNPNWKEIPISENVSTIVYGHEEVTENSVNSRSAMFLDDSDPLSSPKPRIPEIENGYYYFEDRLSSGEERWDDSQVLDREAHYDFVLAIYDIDTSTLYFCQRNN